MGSWFFTSKKNLEDRVETVVPFDNDIGSIVKYSGTRPQLRLKERGIFTDDEPQVVASYNPFVTEIIDSSSNDNSSSSDSSSDNWSGDGGGFDGGGSSGDW